MKDIWRAFVEGFKTPFWLVYIWGRIILMLTYGGLIQAQYWVRRYKYWGGKWVKRNEV